MARKTAATTRPVAIATADEQLPSPAVAKASEEGGRSVLRPAVSEDKPPKVRKAKLVKGRFTIPKLEHAILQTLKERAARLGRPAKKSELVRAGVTALEAMGDEAFEAAIASVPPLKTTRAKTSKH